MAKRGIVITPDLGKVERDRSATLDPAYLRWCVLYWDVLDCPDDVLLSETFSNSRADVELLQQERILTRTKGYFFYKRPDGNPLLGVHLEHPREFWMVAQLYAFYKHSQHDSGWSIGQPSQTLFTPEPQSPERYWFVESGPLPPDQRSNILVGPRAALQHLSGQLGQSQLDTLHEKRAVEVTLHRALFSPSAEMPVEQVLEFKTKRNDELLRFRSLMGNVYQSVIASTDPLRAIAEKLETIALTLDDLHTKMRKQGLSLNPGILKVLLPVLEHEDVETTVDMVGELDIPFFSTGAKIMCKLIKIFQPKRIPDEYRDYAYLYYAQKELSK